MKIIRVFHLKNIQFLEVKFSIYLNRRVFVMLRTDCLCISVLRVASKHRVKLLLTVLRRWSRCCSYPVKLCGLFYKAIYIKSCLAFVLVFLLISFSLCPCLYSRATLRSFSVT